MPPSSTLSAPRPPATPAAGPARVSLLGDFGVSAGRRPLSLCASGQRVVAYLAVHGRGRPVTRTTLAAALWTDAPPSRAAARLRTALWRLAQLTQVPVVAATATTAALADGVDVDLWRAESQAHSVMAPPDAAPAVPPTPTAVFRSDLLPAWADDWLVLEREAFRQTRLHALEATSAALLAAGEHHGALEAALAAVQCEPLRESAHRAVIAVHLAEGNPAEALRQYQGFRRLLSAELGLPPTQAIRAMVAPLLGRPLEAPARRVRPA